jgi:hypothetical protein
MCEEQAEIIKHETVKEDQAKEELIYTLGIGELDMLALTL